jgi:integrase
VPNSHLLAVKEASAEYNIGIDSLYRHKHEIGFIKRPGTPILFDRKNIERWLEEGGQKAIQFAEFLPKVDNSLDGYDKLFLERRTELSGITRWSYSIGSVLKRENKNKEDRYHIHYQVNGHRVRKSLKWVRSRAEAVKVLNQEVAEALRGQGHFQNKKLTFCEMADLFLNKYSRPKKKSWKSADRVYIRNMKRFFCDTRLAQITPLMIEDYKIERLETGKGRRPGEKPSEGTINRELQCLRKIFKKAIDWGYSTENPACKVDFLTEKGRVRKRVLSEDEESRLIAVAPPYMKHMIIVVLETGMRRGEVLKLKWEHVDFDGEEITIVETKDNEDRIMPMSSALVNLLSMLKSRNGNSEFVFSNPRTGKPYVDVKRAFNSACEKANVEDFNFHDLRHTFGSRVARVAPIHDVKDLMGHSSITTTQRYLHSNAEQKREAVNNMARRKHGFSVMWQTSGKPLPAYSDDDAISSSYPRS